MRKGKGIYKEKEQEDARRKIHGKKEGDNNKKEKNGAARK
jgi:hypothetical protein